MRRLIAFVFLSVIFVTSTSAQSPISILQRMILAGGWSPASLPSDMVITADVVMLPNSESPATTKITFKAKGSTRFRWENSDTANNATVVDMSTGKARGPMRIAPSTLTTQPWLTPFLGKLHEFADPNARIDFLGMEQISEQTYKLQIRRVPNPSDPRADEITAGSPITIWISSTSFLPVQIEYLEQSNTNRLAFGRITRRYSDYRKVQGLLVAFHQEIWSGQKLLYSVGLKTVQLNVGLSDSDFGFQEGQ